jgi:nucleoside-diphosphate-sugar epimerase
VARLPMLTRRVVNRALAAGAATLAVPTVTIGAAKTLKLLFLGGTGFLGPHTVRAALDRGHTVTLFNRGKTAPDLFPDLETINGDRNTDDIRRLSGRRWDVVIDTSAYFPRSVRMAADALGAGLEHYILISTVSVYTTWSTPNMDESSPVRTVTDPTVEEIRQPATYGALKALCERAASDKLPGRVTSIRPGFIVGPGDETDRFTYWPVRIARGGEVLAPGTGRDSVQFIDVRDLAAWIVYCAERPVLGTFNAHHRAGELTMRRCLETCRATLNDAATLTWVGAEFLERAGVQSQVDLPIWLPGGMELSAARARENGLSLRPLEATVRDTYGWFSGLPAERRSALRAGLSSEREREALVAWHASVDR